MQYFKIDKPYLALVKANHAGEALSRYSAEVAKKETDDYMWRLGRYEALGIYVEAVDKTESGATIRDVVRDFDNPNKHILLVDGNLI